MTDVAIHPSGTAPAKFAGIFCSALPVRAMAQKDETYFVPQHISASGLFDRYQNRFDAADPVLN